MIKSPPIGYRISRLNDSVPEAPKYFESYETACDWKTSQPKASHSLYAIGPTYKPLDKTYDHKPKVLTQGADVSRYHRTSDEAGMQDQAFQAGQVHRTLSDTEYKFKPKNFFTRIALGSVAVFIILKIASLFIGGG